MNVLLGLIGVRNDAKEMADDLQRVSERFSMHLGPVLDEPMAHEFLEKISNEVPMKEDSKYILNYLMAVLSLSVNMMRHVERCALADAANLEEDA